MPHALAYRTLEWHESRFSKRRARRRNLAWPGTPPVAPRPMPPCRRLGAVYSTSRFRSALVKRCCRGLRRHYQDLRVTTWVVDFYNLHSRPCRVKPSKGGHDD